MNSRRLRSAVSLWRHRATRRLLGPYRDFRARARGADILAVRSHGYFLYKPFLHWLGGVDPGLHDRIDVRHVGELFRDRARYRIALTWFDPLVETGDRGRAWLRRLEAGGAMINRLSGFENTRKSVQAKLLAEAGFDTPPVGRPEKFEYPLLIRSDIEHSGVIHRLDSAADLAAFDPGSMREPVAAPFLETRSGDGLYRKYRYVLCGDHGAPRHLQVSDRWLVRMEHRKLTTAHIDEEVAYTGAVDPRHDELNRARKALGLDFVAFDYSLRPDGSMVVWEANPLPCLWLKTMDSPRYEYQRPAIERIWEMRRQDLVARVDREEPDTTARRGPARR